MSYLEVKNIIKEYRQIDKTIKAVDNISFNIEKGEFFSILGPNGAGKTTLINLMCGLLYPTSGEILFNNSSILNNYSNFQERIGAVLEGNRNIYWYLSAWENLKYFGRLLYLDENTIAKKAEYFLDFFNLLEIKNEKVGHYSRGMQQKVAICVALINSPEILFLDEPTLGLDVVTKAQMVNKLKELSQETSTTIIMTTHQLEISEKLSDRILILDNGKLLHLKTPDLLKDFFSEKKYLIRIENNNFNEDIFNEIDLKNYFSYTINTKEYFTEIILEIHSGNETNILNKVLLTLLNHNYKFLNFSKDEPNLENIFINLFKK